MSGSDKHQNRHRNDRNDDGKQHIAHLRPEFHHACRSRNKKQREDAGQKDADFLDVFQLDDAEPEREQQQDQTIDAGRDRQRKNGVQDLAQKTERKDPRKLKQIFRRNTSFDFSHSLPVRMAGNGLQPSQQYSRKSTRVQQQY